ncbi:antibiotic biosynthesis monooxygenase [Nonomuraea sp. NBC_00507]|uniref:antibiotic biosynthesis monooxygenase n=1 Tax=Nonomuraea sp. NBC_00507 TaxID=2976002 RepID=UPI002E191D8B
MKPYAHRGPGGGVATVVISSKVREGREADYRRWQQKINDTMRSFPGCQGSDVYPPIPGEQDVWVVVFRFSSTAELTGWLDSETRRRLLEEVRPLLEKPSELEILAGEPPTREAVTAVISHNVRPGRERDFQRWQDKVRKTQEKFPGFLGFEAFEPVPGVQEHWVVMFRYDTREHLDAWLESDTRRKLLDEGRHYFADFDVRTVKSAFSGWFRFNGETAREPPPNWKQAMSVLLGLYPTVMILNLTVGRAFEAVRLPGYLAMFISNGLSVSILTWLMMPLVNRTFTSWLSPSGGGSVFTNIAGALVMVACMALCIAVFGLITM